MNTVLHQVMALEKATTAAAAVVRIIRILLLLLARQAVAISVTLH